MQLRAFRWAGYGEALAIVAAATAVAWIMHPYVEASNLAMTYLLGVVVVARRRSRGPALLASLSSVAAFNFFFIPPYYTFAVADTHYVLTFATMLVVALVVSDLTVRVRAEAEAARAAEVRAESERLRSALLSAVSHDLRTPLSAITGAVSTVLESGERLDSVTRRELLEAARDEAERLNRLVQNLLQMTRLKAGVLPLDTDWHSMEEVVGAALARLASRLGDRPVTTRLPAELPLIRIDDVLIEQVLINLLENAAKHSPVTAPIEVAVEPDTSAVRVEVADRGPGIAPGTEQRIFETFYRGDPRASHGAGLGLAICEAIVRAHGGTIEARNRRGGGLAVWFSLPRGIAPPVVAAETHG